MAGMVRLEKGNQGKSIASNIGELSTSVYEAARRPVPYFEGTPERTHIRLRMSPSTPYWEKPEVLRRAEDWEEDQRQRALVRVLLGSLAQVS
eukprot:98195-Pelagomonas_calceolata.AAC.4